MSNRKAIPKDWIDAYFTHGIDKDNRRIFLDGAIDAESSQNIRRSILYLDSLDKEAPIELWICSEGGDEYYAWSIYDTLRTVTCPIHTIATGMCMSAAPLLVAAGEPGHRYATPNSWFMVHQSWGEWGVARVDEVKKTVQHTEEMGKRWYQTMEEHTVKTGAFWKKICENVGDRYFSAEVAVEYGIVDQLWSEK